MKEVERRKKVRVVQTDMELIGHPCSFNNSFEVTTKLLSDSVISYDGYVEVIVKELVPETLYEFRKEHELTKEELLNWLNDNYK